MACKRSAVRSRLSPPKHRFLLHKFTVKAPKSPSSRGLGHDPFTVVTGVRIPLGTPPIFANVEWFVYRVKGPFWGFLLFGEFNTRGLLARKARPIAQRLESGSP
jgi:hypothetical protein